MNHRRNRIATDSKDQLEWYWLKNNVSGAVFAVVGGGDLRGSWPYLPGGVRTVFKLLGGEINDNF